MKNLNFSSYKYFLGKVFKTGLIELIISNLFVQLSALITIIFLADLLNPDEIGFFRLLFAYFVFFQMLGLIGCNSSILKFCSENVETKIKISRLAFYRKRSFRASLFSTLIFNIFMFTFVTPISNSAIFYMHIYTFCIPLAVYSLCSMALLQALKEVRVAALAQGLIRVSFFILSIVGGIYGGLEFVIYFTVIGYLLGSVSLYLVTKPKIKYLKKDSLTFEEKKLLKYHSNGMFLAAVLSVVQQNIDFYLLGFLGASYSFIANFGIAALIFNVGSVVVGTIQTVISPFISENQDDLNWVRNRTIKFQLLLIPMSFIFGILMYFGLVFLNYLGFFSEYTSILEYSIPVLIKYFVWSCFAILGASLFAIGIVRETLIHAAILIVINILLSLITSWVFDVEKIIYVQPIVMIFQLAFCLYLFDLKTKERK